jgi:hypothetical protein
MGKRRTVFPEPTEPASRHIRTDKVARTFRVHFGQFLERGTVMLTFERKGEPEQIYELSPDRARSLAHALLNEANKLDRLH